MKTKLDCLKLINFIEKSIDFKKNILPCKNILIAYSGGQDSSALLAIFYILSKKWHFNIGVVYCNHNWTHSTKASSTAFDIIQNLNLPFYFVDSKRAIKPENQARDWRYKAFATILNSSQYDLILTGHTLSDCAETIIFNLCRGSGLKGVCSLKKFQVFHGGKGFQFQIKTFSAEDFTNYSARFLFMV
jgi:tRNA(Ile)-lysidine synthase